MQPRPPPDPERRNPDLQEQDGVSEGIEALPNRISRYSKAKRTAIDIGEYIATSPHAQALSPQLDRLKSCGDYLIFRHFFTIDQVKLHGARLCMQHFLCPLCAIRRGAKHLKSYLDRFETIRTRSPELKPYLVTLTVKDGPDLLERFRHLHAAQRELWMRKHRGQRSSLAGVAGAVWSYEVKRGAGSGLWHPHLHMVALAETMPDQQSLAREWHGITGDSHVVDVRPIDQAEPARGFIEVFKYAVKFSDQSHADTVHAFLTLRGKRLLGSAGCFRGVVVPESLCDDHTSLAGLPFVDLFYRYMPGGYALT